MFIEDHKNPYAYFIDIKPGTCFKKEEEEEMNSIYVKVRSNYNAAIDLRNGNIIKIFPKSKIIPLYEAKIVTE